MENHLLRHGEAMEAELKAMGAVQLGVRMLEKESARERDGRRSVTIDRRSIVGALSLECFLCLISSDDKSSLAAFSISLLLSCPA